MIVPILVPLWSWISRRSWRGICVGHVMIKKMTQEELADRAGLSMRYVGAIERGDVSASVTILGQIADALEIEPGELLKKVGAPK